MPELPYTSEILNHFLPSIEKHAIKQQTQSNPRPFILGLTGLQGSGKSTLAADIVQKLNHTHNIRSIEISLDDFYLTHHQRQNLHELGADPKNALLRVRGQPGTHDAVLAEMTFGQFSTDADDRKTAKIYLSAADGEIVMPVFDKGLFAGEGDRLPRKDWRNFTDELFIQVIVFEGWCLGFRPGGDANIESFWKRAKESRENRVGEVNPRFSIATLADQRLEDLLFVDKNLREYCECFMGPRHLDALIHLDTQNLANVYSWRLQQEHAMRKSKKSGMTDHQVVDFVKGYMPAYEIYLGGLREGFFKKGLASEIFKPQLHVVLDKQRKIVKTKLI